MIKIKRAISIKKLRRNILFMTKDDRYFFSICGHPQEMFFYLFDRATNGFGDVSFHVFYCDGLPIAVVGLSKSTKQVRLFYIDRSYRSKATVSEVLHFIHKKLGNVVCIGTTKKNERFVEFCENNKWELCVSDDENVLYKVTKKE